jgi:hypothetical protein
MQFSHPAPPEHHPSQGVISAAGIMFAVIQRENLRETLGLGRSGMIFVGSIRWVRQQEGTVRW